MNMVQSINYFKSKGDKIMNNKDNERLNSRDDERKDPSTNNKRGTNSGKSNRRTHGDSKYHGSRRSNNSRSRECSGKDDSTEFIKDNDSKGYVNDPRWYMPDKALAESTAQWSFTQPAGEPIIGNDGERSVYPSIMKLYLEPSPEISNINDTGVFSKYGYKFTGLNAASRAFYNAISSMTGRTSAYTPDDISILFLGIGEIISMFSYARHIMHLPYMINLKNKSIPDALISAYGFDPIDLRTNIATYRTQFNTLIVQAQSIIAPGNMPYFEKCANVYSHIFADTAADTAQMYIFAPYSTWILNEKYNANGSGLVTTAVPGRMEYNIKLSKLFDLIATMISTFQESSTYNVVGQDVLHLNAKTNMPIYTYQFLSEFETTAVEYNENALLQIHNMNFGGPYNIALYDAEMGLTPLNDVSCSVDKVSIFYNPAIKNDAKVDGFNVNNIYMDSLTAQPDSDMRIDATRYISYVSKSVYHVPSKSTYIQFGCGDHRGIAYAIYSVENNKITEIGNTLLRIYGLAKTANFTIDTFKYSCCLSAFDWAPIMFIHYNSTGNVDDGNITTVTLGNINYITPISAEVMNNLNRLSEQFLFTARTSNKNSK